MARSRNIKPAIMSNEDLAELKPIERLLFIYLWMLADREGRLEDRPKRIRAEALPYDNVDADKMLDQLVDAGFIRRYSVDGEKIIQIVNFLKHQNPHVREAASALPEEGPETTEIEPPPEKDDARHCLGSAEASPRSPDSLIPDSLIPDSNKPPCAPPAHGADPKVDLFDRFWKLYPRKQDKAKARKAFAKLKVTDDLFAQIGQALAAQAASHDWCKDGGRFIPLPTTWLNGRRWEDEAPTATNVHKFPGQSRHSGFDNRDYTAGLTEREDGTYAF